LSLAGRMTNISTIISKRSGGKRSPCLNPFLVLN
jgi:hypothetical protein